MREILSPKDITSIRDSVDSIRGSASRVSAMYYVVVSESSPSGNPIEPIFGERINPFSTSGYTKSETFIPFEGSIISEEPDDGYDVAGFEHRKKLTVDTSVDTERKQNIPWRSGSQLMVNGDRFRVVSVDRSGVVPYNRILLELEQLTYTNPTVA